MKTRTPTRRGHGAKLVLCDREEFTRRIERAVADCALGRPAALIHLDVSRAHDVLEHCGRNALDALRRRVHDVTCTHLGGGVAGYPGDDCDLSLLLLGLRPSESLQRAQRLLESLDADTFTWHEHPFRLGVHIGLVELGASVGRPATWLELAREACVAASDLGGSGLRAVPLSVDALGKLERDREWHDHLAESI